MMNKKAIAPFIVWGIIIIVVLTASGISIPFLKDMGLGALTDFTKVYKLNWGHIECVQNADYNIQYTRYLEDQQLFKCDDYTNECLFVVSTTSKAGWLGAGTDYQICDYTGTSCIAGGRVSVGAFASPQQITTFNVAKGKAVKFSLTANTIGEEIIQIDKKVKTFYIRGVENGNVFTQESCVLSAGLRSRVTNDGLNELTFSGTNSRQNYVTDFIEVATKTYQYSGQEVICQARILYSITQQPMKDGSVVKVQSGTLKGVDCCPTEANCDPTTFKFVANNVRQCSYSSECSNGGQPIAVTSTSYYKFACLSGTCVKGSVITTECTNDQACVLKYGTNSVCDLSSNNYGKCITQTKPNYCGNGKCESLDGEDGTTCPADCSNCPTGFIYNVAQKKCEPLPSSGWPIWLWVIIIFLVFILAVKFVPSLRSLFKRTPVLKWITP